MPPAYNNSHPVVPKQNGSVCRVEAAQDWRVYSLGRGTSVKSKPVRPERSIWTDGCRPERGQRTQIERERECSRCERQTFKVIIPIVNKWLHRKPKKQFSMCCVHTQCASKRGYSSVAEHSTADREVAGSTPAVPCHNTFSPSESPSSLPLCLKFLISNFLQYLLIFYLITSMLPAYSCRLISGRQSAASGNSQLVTTRLNIRLGNIGVPFNSTHIAILP